VTPKDRPTQTMTWRARRVERSDYFAHTGTAMFDQPADPLTAPPGLQ
jgi:hypothetical protein